ncbi:MAG: mechanosensitive ion channel domain-containing protein [Bacteroidota bacterium]
MDYLKIAEGLIVQYVPPILKGIFTLIIGLWIVGMLTKAISKQIHKNIKDATLARFLSSMVGIALKIMLFLAVASSVGIEVTSFIAILGAAGLAVGLALQGSLSNFAGGVLILILRPFKVGDFISGAGSTGTVKEIQIFHTILNTPDNHRVLVPNGSLANTTITNFSHETTRRIDLVIGIGYDSDLKKAKELLMEIIKAHPNTLDDPEPKVMVLELADSSVNIGARPWVNRPDFFGTMTDLLETIKLRFDEEGIEIPYPHQVVQVQNLEK